MKNPEADVLAKRLAARKRLGKTEAVRVTLKNEWEREQASDDMVELAVAFCREFWARAPMFNPQAAGKDFVDSLCESG